MNRSSDLISGLREYFRGKKNVQKVILFGSRARGEETRRSDADLFIVIREPAPYLERLEAFRDLLLRFPKVEWDLIVWTEEELARGRERPFIREILREGKVIYERTEES